MRLKGATTILNKEAEFLNMKFSDLLAFIERSPLSFPKNVVEAFKVYKKESV